MELYLTRMFKASSIYLLSCQRSSIASRNVMTASLCLTTLHSNNSIPLCSPSNKVRTLKRSSYTTKTAPCLLSKLSVASWLPQWLSQWRSTAKLLWSRIWQIHSKDQKCAANTSLPTEPSLSMARRSEATMGEALSMRSHAPSSDHLTQVSKSI